MLVESRDGTDACLKKPIGFWGEIRDLLNHLSLTVRDYKAMGDGLMAR